ncbi:MAG: NFYB/HAP3 family transcription factor subunit [Nanoarchaeota archaeon]|nr:NFYB/HAP3 family transcription factor subunit [Nanoarchaeota archaeon]MBU1135743.1 NFYB/HAP3 family transcription factor subunit [Nanoarchaeota archaeon]MBU2520164.1 NFYB/HAP3 family transcription factor subunit [Nanoarchaeota archaeon]
MKRKTKLPLAPFERVLKESGPNIRVSKESVEAFTDVMEEISGEIARDSFDLARHAERKTIKASDVKISWKRFRK